MFYVAHKAQSAHESAGAVGGTGGTVLQARAGQGEARRLLGTAKCSFNKESVSVLRVFIRKYTRILD